MVEFKVIKGSSSGKLVESTTSRLVKDDEVLIKVTHSGVCFTDQVMNTHPAVHTIYQLTDNVALSPSRHGARARGNWNCC